MASSGRPGNCRRCRPDDCTRSTRAPSRARCWAWWANRGCGKSTLAYQVLGYRHPMARVTGGEVRFKGELLLSLRRSELDALRGNRIALVPQDPTTALSPGMRVGGGRSPSARDSRALRLPGGGGAPSGGVVRERLAARSRTGPASLSPPVLGRPAAAGADRDGARLQSRPGSAGRADHRTGRNHPGADSPSAARSARALLDRDALRHPRSRGNQRDRRPGGG